MTETPSLAEQRAHFHKLLTHFQTAMLVTHAGEDRLRARPMAIAQVEADSRLWFITGAETAKTHEIEADTRVQVVCQNDRSAYLSLSGHAELVRDRAKIAALWKESFRVWFPAGQEDPEIVLIAVRPEEGEFWDQEGYKKIKYLLETAKAYATGKTPEIAEGEQHGFVKL